MSKIKLLEENKKDNNWTSCQSGCSKNKNRNPLNHGNSIKGEWVPFSCAYNDGSGGFLGYIQEEDVGVLSTWSGVSCQVLYV